MQGIMRLIIFRLRFLKERKRCLLDSLEDPSGREFRRDT